MAVQHLMMVLDFASPKRCHLKSIAADTSSVAHDKVCSTVAAPSACVSRLSKTDTAKLATEPSIPNVEQRNARNASWDWLKATLPITGEGRTTSIFQRDFVQIFDIFSLAVTSDQM